MPLCAAEEQVKATYDAINAQIRERDPDWPGDISVEQSVRDQLALFDRVTLDISGQFVRRDGGDPASGPVRN